MNTIENNNPIEHFQQWFYEVEQNHPEDEVNAMTLSTIGIDGFPKNRIVLLKRFTWEGFIFFTNYNSEKGKSITKNNKVSILFNWKKSKREIFISGIAEKIAKNLSDGYFESRPTGSKLSTWASEQSNIIPSRKILDDRLAYYDTKFKNKSIPRPKHWGGYIIKPQLIKFIDHNFPIYENVITYKLQEDYNWSKETNYTGV